MVCKENVVSWFGNLSSYKRIDVMCTLLNMCVPFEVRYLGTCVEELGKRDYNVLRDTEYRANNVNDLTELSNLGTSDKRTRQKLVLYMALLNSYNHACSVIFYEILSKFDMQEISQMLNGTNFSPDDKTLEELLLLYIMALNHPVFNYEQKSFFGDAYLKLQEEESRLNDSKSSSTAFKSSQTFPPCANQNERIDADVTNCAVAPPAMQTFQGEVPMRSNTIIAGMSPTAIGLPPGICIPSPEQMAMHGAHPQYVHVGFPAPWTGQIMMGHNQFMYHPTEVLPFPTSPLVSRQSSPSQSQVHSRSNSPSGPTQRKNTPSNISSNGPQQQQPHPRTSSQVTQTTSNTMTTSSSTFSNQTNLTNLGITVSLPPLPSVTTGRNVPGQAQQPMPPPLMSIRPMLPSNSGPYPWHNNNIEQITTTTGTAKQQQQQPPPPRLKPGEPLRETGNKEMPNFKGNYQNCSNNEIRRLSDEDISKTDMTSNVLNNIKSQAANGLSQTPEKKIDTTNNAHSTNEPIENEIMPVENVPNDNGKPIPEQAMVNYHHQNNTVMANVRRYPPQMDPGHIQMFQMPPAMYPAQNACYSCLATAVPVAGMQNRMSRCNGPQMYCLASGLQALRVDSESAGDASTPKQCSQGSSSDSTGSRSPPETPPAVPWYGNDNGLPIDLQQPPPPHHSMPAASHAAPQQPSNPDNMRHRPRKSQHVTRHKNSSTTMLNGAAPPTSLQPCMTFPGPPGQPITATYLPHHFPALRHSSGIYTNFTPAYRPAPAGYPTIAYQPNGEMIYQYSGHPLPASTGAPTAGTPPPAAAALRSTPPPPPQQPVTFAPLNAPQQQTQRKQPAEPPKISCYNCGSNAHVAVDCKEQTMDDITRKAQYRLDYTTAKTAAPGGDQTQSSDK